MIDLAHLAHPYWHIFFLAVRRATLPMLIIVCSAQAERKQSWWWAAGAFIAAGFLLLFWSVDAFAGEVLMVLMDAVKR